MYIKWRESSEKRENPKQIRADGDRKSGSQIKNVFCSIFYSCSATICLLLNVCIFLYVENALSVKLWIYVFSTIFSRLPDFPYDNFHSKSVTAHCQCLSAIAAIWKLFIDSHRQRKNEIEKLISSLLSLSPCPSDFFFSLFLLIILMVFACTKSYLFTCISFLSLFLCFVFSFPCMNTHTEWWKAAHINILT